MPSVVEMLTAENLRKFLRKISRKNKLDEDCLYRLIRFLLATNRTHLVKLPKDDNISEMNTPWQVPRALPVTNKLICVFHSSS